MKARVAIERSFVKALKGLPPDRREAAIETIEKFMFEPALPRLEFRPLKARPSYFIIDARHGDRVILRKDDEAVYAAVDVGPHDNIYRRWNRR